MNQHWSDLSNAHHIDWVLASLKNNPELWTAAWYAAWPAASEAGYQEVRDAAYDAAYDAAWSAARGAARDVACSAAGDAAWDEVFDAGWGAAWDEARDAAWEAARVAALALIAYDDCDEYLKMSYEELRIWAVLSENPAAILLLPMVYVREKLHEPALV